MGMEPQHSLLAAKPFRAEVQQSESLFLPLPGLTAPESYSGFHARTPSALVTSYARTGTSSSEVSPSLPDPALLPVAPDPDARDENSQPQLAIMPRPSAPNAALSAEIRAAALAEGQALGRAEAEAALSAEREALSVQARAMATALERLTRPPLAEVDALSRALGLAVNRLASERAGLAIDTMPAAFAGRIARLVERMAQGMRDVAVHLHPDDLAALRPLLDAACPPELAVLASARLLPDARLSRGDADLRAPGLRLGDLIDAPEPEPPTQGAI